MDNDRLDTLRRLLHLESANVSFKAEDYERELCTTFGSLRRLPLLDVDGQVFAHSGFASWKGGNSSSLFFLHGATVAPDLTSHSWLSPAAVKMVRRFSSIFGGTENAEYPVVLSHYLHQIPDSVNAIHEKVSLIMVISSIIHQVLISSYGVSVIRDEEKFAFLRQSLDALQGPSTKRTREQCRRLGKILNKLLLEINVKCLVTVIDRLDKLQGSMERAVEILLDLMESTKVTIKIFLTARSRAAFDDADVKEQLEGRYFRLTLNQDD